MRVNPEAVDQLQIELSSLKSAVDLLVVRQLLQGQFENIEASSASNALKAIETFARRANEILSAEGNVVESEAGSVHVLGSHARVVFPSLNGVEVDGKVDTGATSSSLHATDVQANGGRVSFKSEMISRNVITLPMEGTQEVHSADFGGDQRPVVRLDVEVDGVPLKAVPFNLNDRSKMDSKLLIGQDILKAGNFQVDVSRGDQESAEHEPAERAMPESTILATEEDYKIYEAICFLIEHDVSLGSLVEYLRLEAINRIKD